MKIAFVSDAIFPYNKGGKEKRIFELTTRLAKKGHNVHLYCMKWWRGPNNRLENNVNLHAICKLYPLYSGKRRSIKQALIFSLACLKLIIKDFDIIDADHMPFFPLFSIKLACLLRRKKMIATWNEVWGEKYWQNYLGWKGIFGYLIEKLSILMPDKIISISCHTTNKLKNSFKTAKEIFTIPNGVDSKEIQKTIPSKQKSDIIFCGRLLKHKNIDVLINSIFLVKKSFPKIKSFIIGEGPERKNLELLAKKLKLEKNIRFLNFINNQNCVYSLLKASKVFVLPSTREGFGIVALEANACGLPVITVNHKNNAAKDLIKKGKNGLICRLNKKDVSDKIIELLAKKTNKKRKQDYINTIIKYDWNNIVNDIEKIYKKSSVFKPAKKLAIVTTSWDDGHKLDLKLAKLLKKYRLKGTFYIAPQNREFGKADLLTDKEIIKLSHSFEIGYHTLTHPQLTKLNGKNASREITDSKKYLEKLIKKPIKSFCYPRGNYSKKVKNMVKKACFTCARTTAQMITRPKNDYLELGTTIQAFPLSIRALGGEIKYALKNNPNLLPYLFTKDWAEIAKKTFDYVQKAGGVYHLWGHSWMIEKFGEWQKLEQVLAYLSNKSNILYLTNSGMIKAIRK